MIRLLYPTDLPILLQFNSGAPPNAVRTRDRLGEREGSPFGVGELLRQWLPLGGRRHTWVSVRGLRIQSLLSMKSLSGPSCFEIDYLVVGDDEETSVDLLGRLGLSGGRLGIRKVFLRLPSDSPLAESARKASFAPYLAERLYRLEGGGRETAEGPLFLRPGLDADEYKLFQLYSSLVPEPVRRAEGMTFREWQQSRERGGREFVHEENGSISGWVRILTQGSTGQFDIMAHPSEEENLEGMVGYGLASLRGKSPILCLVPEFQVGLGGTLYRMGFEEVGEYSIFVKELSAPIRQPSLAPAEI